MVYVCSMGINAHVVVTSIGGPLTSEAVIQPFKGGLKFFNHAMVLRDDLNGHDFGGCICTCERSELRISETASEASQVYALEQRSRSDRAKRAAR